jgi:hypothetical protein
MKKIFLISLLFVIVAHLLSAQTLSPKAALLFRDVKTTLSIDEKNQITEMCKLTMSKDRKKFILADDPQSEYTTEVYSLDLNKDGIEEVYVAELSTFFGPAATAFTIFTKYLTGNYHEVISVSGDPRIVSTTTSGFANIIVGGPGFEFPIWKFNGKTYAFAETISGETMEKMNPVEIPVASEEYINGIGKKAVVIKPVEKTVIDSSSVKIKTVEVLSDQARMLFNNVKIKISISQKNVIAAMSKIVKMDTSISNGLGKTKIYVSVLPVDLNDDGAEEIFITIKTTELGISNTKVQFYSVNKSENNKFISQELTGPIKILQTKSNDYPDLMTGSGNMDKEIWKWNKQEYKFFSKINGIAALAYKNENLESLSEKYTSTIIKK